MRFRPLWIAVPACAAAGVLGYSVVAAQESPPKATPKPGQLKPPLPDTRAAQGMFGPPPGQVGMGVKQSSNEAPVPQPFFPNAGPPPGDLPAGMRPPQIIVESSSPEPKALPLLQPAAATVPPPLAAPSLPEVTPPAPSLPTTQAKQLPVIAPPVPAMPAPASAITTPAPAPLAPVRSEPMPVIAAPAVPSGPQPLVPAAPKPLPLAAKAATPFPNMQLLAKQTPSIAIECVAPESVSVGQSLEYFLVVKNTGATTVANVRIEDELPAGARFISSEPAAELNGDRLIWTISALEAGGEKRIKITVKPADEGELRSRAMVSFTSGAEARVKVTRPRIAVALAGSGLARVGDEVPFQIRVTNSGSGTATNLLVKARLSDGLHHPAGGLIEAIIDKLAPGETRTITLRALATKAGTNGCNISAAGEGLNTEVASSNVNIVEPMLAAKVSGPAKCLVRSEPEFRIDLSNPGSAATDPVQVWAALPEGFEFAGASDAGNFQAANRTVIWTLPALAAGSQRTLAIKLKAAAAADGHVRIVAQSVPTGEAGVVNAGAKASSTRVIEAKAEAAVKAEGVPALRFEVVDVEDPVEVGKEALYDIRVVNQGTGACTNLTVTVFLAEGTATAGATGPTTARGQGQQISFDAMPTLATKGEAVYRVRVKGSQAGDMKLRVQVACDEVRTPVAKEENTRFIKD